MSVYDFAAWAGISRPWAWKQGFLIHKMKRFERFGDKRNINSHMQSLPGYRRMLKVFEPMRVDLVGRELNAAQIVEILNARRHSGA